ncbi:hypothetical protein DFH09DRAFT_1361764 [Mycena vulgaris]|nr:hypothetical protein DFH09DRAFT_1361764 [Mycena vulgaris]
MDPSDGTPPTRAEGLWFDDGNLVLQAGNSLFRVAKGILGARSSIFSDLFTLPQHGEADIFEGCPFVRLPDSAEDITPFLKAIFDSSFFEPPPTRTTLADVLGILRMSHKYEVLYLRRRALLHLDTVYPTNLAAYDARNTAATFKAVNGADHLRVARAATQAAAPWLVPCAVYDAYCSGTRCISALDTATALDYIQTRCLTGLVKQVQAFGARPQYYFLLPSPSIVKGCQKMGRCATAATMFLEAWNKSGIQLDTTDPLMAWEHQLRSLDPARLCAPCLDTARASTTTYREEWWALMPATYGLQDWGELLLLREAAFSES